MYGIQDYKKELQSIVFFELPTTKHSLPDSALKKGSIGFKLIHLIYELLHQVDIKTNNRYW